MTIISGKVHDGRIELPRDTYIPDGTPVEVHVPQWARLISLPSWEGKDADEICELIYRKRSGGRPAPHFED